jgi:outer membrane lipoprotein-sorting protein
VKSLTLPSFSGIAVAVIAVAGVYSSARGQSEPVTAETVLQKMLTAYSEANSYSANSVANYRNPDGSERLKVEFRTWFARPAHFRIDALSTPPGGGNPRREVLWTDGTTARSWASDKPVTSKPKVQLVGSGMFGTYAYHIPTLLEPSYAAAKRLHEMVSPVLGEDETFEGTECYRVRGNWQGGDYELWIGKADHLVRKLVAQYSDHDMEEIHREIAPNTPIPLEVFRFAPEKEAVPPPKK